MDVFARKRIYVACLIFKSRSVISLFFFLTIILPIKNGQDKIGVWATLISLGTDRIKATMLP